LPKGDAAAENDKYLNCVENALGLREWLESSGHTVITTADKEGSDSGNFYMAIHILHSQQIQFQGCICMHLTVPSERLP
jgi:hypothetical protein